VNRGADRHRDLQKERPMKTNGIIQKFSCFLFILLISACATGMPGIPGAISESQSQFDGTKQVSMEPAWLYSTYIKLALFKNSKMNKDDIIMTAVVKGAHNFAKGASLHFNVDGDIISFNSVDSLTDINTSSGSVGSEIYIPPSNWSSKDYVVSKQFINKIINANKVIVKIDLRKSYVEGKFSHDGYTTARPAFREFLKKIETL